MTKAPVFYFSLPRLWASWRGQNAARTQNNWLEMNAAGIFLHVVACAFAFRLLLARFDLWLQLLFLLPLAVLVWISWLLFFYLSSLIVKALRTIGFMRDLSVGRAQSVVIGTGISLCALALSLDHAFYKFVGMAWLALAALNLIAAAILKSNVSAAE